MKLQLVDAAGYGEDRIRIDPSVVRGLEYYTGPVYEVELTFEIKDDKGRPVRFGSVGGGGRYDGLVSRFRGEPVPATGFSIGVSRLQAALTALGKLDNKPEPGPVVVTVFDRDRIADYQKMVAALRNAGIRAELYLGNPKHSIGAAAQICRQARQPCAIIQGGDEKAQGRSADQGSDPRRRARPSIKDRDEYLKKQAEAQVAVQGSRAGRGRAQAARAPRCVGPSALLRINCPLSPEADSACYADRFRAQGAWHVHLMPLRIMTSPGLLIGLGAWAEPFRLNGHLRA